MRGAAIFSIGALLCTVGVWADAGPGNRGIDHAPHLISTALRKMAKGIHRVIQHTSPNVNASVVPIYQFRIGDAMINRSQKLMELETGIKDVAMSIEDWVANVAKKDKATKEQDAQDAVLARQEVLKLKHATTRVQNASRMRSAPKAAEIARLQKIRDQLQAEIHRRMPPSTTIPPKRPLPSGNIHALAKYLWAPGREEYTTTSTPPPVAVPVKQNSSQMPKVKKAHSPITSKELADEVMRKQKEAAKEQQQREEAIAEAAQNASLAALRNKKVKMSRKLRGYLNMPTSPPPVAPKKKQDRHLVSAGRKHLLAAEDILRNMGDSANASTLVAPVNSTPASNATVPLAPLAPANRTTSALQLSKLWKVGKDSTNVWPWIKGGVHM